MWSGVGASVWVCWCVWFAMLIIVRVDCVLVGMLVCADCDPVLCVVRYGCQCGCVLSSADVQ